MAANQTFYIKFFAPVVPESIAALMQAVDDKLISQRIFSYPLSRATDGIAIVGKSNFTTPVI